MDIYIIAAILFIVIACNSVATIAVAKCISYEKHQKILQYCLIWLVPIIGAILCYVLAIEEQKLATEFTKNSDDNWRDISQAYDLRRQFRDGEDGY